ncbi:MAG TPA: TonB-dependent receptor [Steroidobacteraceae bacterium]|jgi:iron complex outermembrane receptor protein|nr:TonB-dependent receptor [Steroidobacteraceae bacterium]
MNTTLKLAILTALGAAGPLLVQPSAALAADQSSDSDSLTTIVVTAEKKEEALKDVPMSITALGGGALDKLQDRSFSDYAVLVPGLSLVSGDSGLTRLTLRGQNAGGDGSTVAVYLDESPFGSSNALLNGSVLSGDFDTWDLQRIEVLRGPQGTLYGANSEGGLLKFVTTAPVLGSFSGAVETTGESVDHGGQGGDVRAVLNLPLGDKLAFRISGFDQDVAGYLKDPSTGQSDLNEGHKYGGRASLLAAPTDDLTIRLTASSQQSKYNGSNSVDIDPVTLQPAHGDLSQERLIDEPSSFKYENYNATINWNAGPFSILSTTSYGVLNSDTVRDATNVLLQPPMPVTYGEALGSGILLDNAADLRKFTQELRLSSAPSDRLEWQVGGYFTRETGLLDQHLNGFANPGGASLGNLELATVASIYKESAGFGNLTYHFNSQFDIQAGGRWSTNEQTGTETVSGPLAGPTPTEFSTPSKGHIFTYSVAPRWHVDADTMVYARLASGFRPGGPNVLPPGLPAGVPLEYGSDKTTNVELGIKSTVLDGLLSIDVAAFHVDWTNIQLLELVDGFTVNGNGGKARSQGLEWTFGYVPVHGLTLSWVGAYTDANLTSPAPAAHGNTGDPLPYAPKWSTSLDGEYDWAAFANYKAFAGGTWSYVGTRRTDFGSAVDATDQVSLPSYHTYAVRLGLDNDHYRITLYGKNLADSRGITSYQSSGAPGLMGEIGVIQPRTVGLTLSAKF